MTLSSPPSTRLASSKPWRMAYGNGCFWRPRPPAFRPRRRRAAHRQTPRRLGESPDDAAVVEGGLLVTSRPSPRASGALFRLHTTINRETNNPAGLGVSSLLFGEGAGRPHRPSPPYPAWIPGLLPTMTRRRGRLQGSSAVRRRRSHRTSPPSPRGRSRTRATNSSNVFIDGGSAD